jgi:hypothetical protein
MDISARAAKEDLFGIGTTLDLEGFPSHLGFMVDQLSPAIHLTVESLINNHTIFPFYSPFMQKNAVPLHRRSFERIRKAIQLRGTAAQPEFLRFCSKCVEHDRQHLGETYWHRLHQLGAVQICPQHRIFLQNAEVRRGKDTRNSFISAETIIRSRLIHTRVEVTNEEEMLLIWLAEQSQWLLEHPDFLFSRDQFADFYRQQLASSGLASVGGMVHRTKLIASFASRLPPSCLKRLGCSLDVTANQTSMHCVTKDGSGSPLEHLLVMRFIGLTPESVFESLGCDLNFERGPWPCLNPMCELRNVDVIEDYKKVLTRRGKIFGIFKCQCGYSYSRPGRDSVGRFRIAKNKIVTTGAVWDRELCVLWKDITLSVNEIARRLSSYPRQILLSAIDLGLPLERAGKSLKRPKVQAKSERSAAYDRKREEYRILIQQYVTRNPGAICRELQRRSPSKELQWLREHDVVWVQRTLPTIRRSLSVSRKGSRFVNWAARDVVLTSQILSARSRLRNEFGPPVRITKQRLLDAIGYVGTNVDISRLPKVASALRKASESIEECALRRLDWRIRTTDSNGRCRSLLTLLHDACIRPQWRRLPMFIEAIAIVERWLAGGEYSGLATLQVPVVTDNIEPAA